MAWWIVGSTLHTPTWTEEQSSRQGGLSGLRRLTHIAIAYQQPLPYSVPLELYTAAERLLLPSSTYVAGSSAVRVAFKCLARTIAASCPEQPYVIIPVRRLRQVLLVTFLTTK